MTRRMLGRRRGRARGERRLLADAVHRAAYDVYLADGELAYLNDACDPLETKQPFHLNVYPERIDDLPKERKERGFSNAYTSSSPERASTDSSRSG